jgi:hypothetical protein
MSAAHFCASTLGTGVNARGAGVLLIPIDVVDTAKLSIASDMPLEQRSKAIQARGLRTPDRKAFFSLGFLRCITMLDKAQYKGLMTPLLFLL